MFPQSMLTQRAVSRAVIRLSAELYRAYPSEPTSLIVISKRLLILALAALPLLVACQEPPRVNRDGSFNPPIEFHLPAPHAAGTQVAALIRITTCDSFLASLWFHASTHPAQSAAKRTELVELVGGTRVLEGKVVDYPGVPFPVRLTLTKLIPAGEVPIFQDEGVFPATVGTSIMIVMRDRLLSPGTYRVRLETLAPQPQYAKTPVHLLITTRPNSMMPRHIKESSACAR